MDIRIENWTPTPLEQSLIDGTFDDNIIVAELEDMPEDLLEVQDFEEAMEDLKREIATWK